jgi:hypothetical protein
MQIRARLDPKISKVARSNPKVRRHNTLTQLKCEGALLILSQMSYH